MDLLYNQDEIWEMGLRDARQEATEKAESRRDVLYGELLKLLEPLGRIGDLIAATADRTKLSTLAQEFGLQV